MVKNSDSAIQHLDGAVYACKVGSHYTIQTLIRASNFLGSIEKGDLSRILWSPQVHLKLNRRVEAIQDSTILGEGVERAYTV